MMMHIVVIFGGWWFGFNDHSADGRKFYEFGVFFSKSIDVVRRNCRFFLFLFFRKWALANVKSLLMRSSLI